MYTLLGSLSSGAFDASSRESKGIYRQHIRQVVNTPGLPRCSYSCSRQGRTVLLGGTLNICPSAYGGGNSSWNPGKAPSCTLQKRKSLLLTIPTSPPNQNNGSKRKLTRNELTDHLQACTVKVIVCLTLEPPHHLAVNNMPLVWMHLGPPQTNYPYCPLPPSPPPPDSNLIMKIGHHLGLKSGGSFPRSASQS